MRYASIKKCDVANGTGIRVSLFVSGCHHHCKGCFNTDAWDFNYGNDFTVFNSISGNIFLNAVYKCSIIYNENSFNSKSKCSRSNAD